MGYPGLTSHSAGSGGYPSYLEIEEIGVLIHNSIDCHQ